PGADREDRDDELGGVPERRVQDAAHLRARALGELLGGDAHDPRQRDERQPGRDEDGGVGGAGQIERAGGDRDDDGDGDRRLLEAVQAPIHGSGAYRRACLDDWFHGAARLDVRLRWVAAVWVGLRLRTVASRRPRSRQYPPILALPASLRASVLAAHDITAPCNQSSSRRTRPCRGTWLGGPRAAAAAGSTPARRAPPESRRREARPPWRGRDGRRP